MTTVLLHYIQIRDIESVSKIFLRLLDKMSILCTSINFCNKQVFVKERTDLIFYCP